MTVTLVYSAQLISHVVNPTGLLADNANGLVPAAAAKMAEVVDKEAEVVLAQVSESFVMYVATLQKDLLSTFTSFSSLASCRSITKSASFLSRIRAASNVDPGPSLENIITSSVARLKNTGLLAGTGRPRESARSLWSPTRLQTPCSAS